MKPSHIIWEKFNNKEGWNRNINDIDKLKLTIESIIEYLDEEYEKKNYSKLKHHE